MTDVAKLHDTTDAQVWAEEWCKAAREIEAGGSGRVIDKGWMIGWFANAIETAKMHVTERSSYLAEINRLRTLVVDTADGLEQVEQALVAVCQKSTWDNIDQRMALMELRTLMANLKASGRVESAHSESGGMMT